MNKKQMLDIASQLITTSISIEDNIKDADFAEVRELLQKLNIFSQQLYNSIRKGGDI